MIEGADNLENRCSDNSWNRSRGKGVHRRVLTEGS